MAWHKGSDMHAAAGHAIKTTGAGYRGMPDCPACKYGTLVDGETEDTMRCIDCKAVHTVKRLVELRVLPNTVIWRGLGKRPFEPHGVAEGIAKWLE